LVGFVVFVALHYVDDEPGQGRADRACGGPAIENVHATSAEPDAKLPGFDLAYVPTGYELDSVEDQTQLNGSLRLFVFRSATGDHAFTLTRQVARAIDLSNLAAAMGVSCPGSGDEEPASLEFANGDTRYLYWHAGDRVLALSSASIDRDGLRRVAGGITYDRAEDEAQPLLLPTSTTTPR
jgi:hypothetical protein